MAPRVPGRLRPRIISTFGTTRVVGRQPYAPATFSPGEIPGTHFQRLSRPQGTWFCRKETRKKIPSDTTGNLSRNHPTSSDKSVIQKNSSPEHYYRDTSAAARSLRTVVRTNKSAHAVTLLTCIREKSSSDLGL